MDKFGVQLKSTGLPSSREKERTKQTTVRKNQPSNLKDIKNMFEGNSDGSKDSLSAPLSMGTDFKSRTFTTQKTSVKKHTSSKSAKDEDELALFSQFKFSIDANKNTTLERTNSSDSCHSVGSPRGPRKLHTEDAATAEPQMVKSKLMSSKTFQASVDSKVHRLNSNEEATVTPVDKKMATSALIGNLAILRTLPGGGKKLETPTPSVQSDMSKANGISNEKSSLVKEKKTSSNDNVSLSKDVGPVTSVSKAKEFSVTKFTSKSSDASKLDKESKTKEFRASLSPKACDKRGQHEFGLASTKKPEVAVSSVPLLSRQSSTDSSTSEKSSPRSSLRGKNKLKLDQSLGSDTGSSGSVSPRMKSLSPDGKTDEKPEWMEKSKELVNKFHTKLKKPVISEFSVTASSVTGDTNKSSTSSSSTWTPKSTSPQKTDTVTNTSSTYTKATVSRTSSGRKSDSLGLKEPMFNKDASSSKEFLEKFAKSKDSKEGSEKQLLSRKTSSEQFQKLKVGFEHSDDASKSLNLKPKIEVPNSSQFLERRNSFEKPKPTEVSKCKTLKNLKNEGKILGVKDRISALNQGKGEVVDERFKHTRKSSETSRESDQEYHDVAVNPTAAPNDWPSDSDSSNENMYEYIPATDPVKQTEELPESRLTRKPGQKRKGNNRPSFVPLSSVDSSSEVTTEGSSKEGTLESTEDGTGIEADVEEYDSDGSGSSGIYEPIDPDWESHKPILDSAGQEEPPNLPPGRGRHKKKDGKTIGKKLKKFKEKLGSNTTKQNEGSLPKVSSTSSITSNSSSSGLLKKVGKIMKKSKVNGSQQKNDYDPEEVRVCNSENDSSDINEDIYEDEPVQLRAHIGSSGGEDNSGSDIYEQHGELDSIERIPPRPPPLPPVAPPVPPVPPRLSLPPVPDKQNVPPPRLPSTGKVISPGEDTPALPPRNRISGNINLDMVVPISPGRSGPSWHPPAESYLHGHNVKGSNFNDHVDGGGSSSSSDEAQGGMIKKPDWDYIEPDPPVKGRGTVIRQDSVPQEPAPPIPPPPVMRNREKEPLDKRPSSGYAGFKETPQNSVTAPFDDLIIYKRHLDIKEIEDDIVYIDMSDDQLYGTLDRRFTSKFESEPLYQCYHRDMVSRSSRRHTEMTTVSEDEDEEPVQMTKPDRGERIYEAVEDIDETPKTKKLSTLEMFGKTGSVLRALWAEMPEVKESGALEKVSPHERKIQEAMFEIITSEASYLKSLNVLIDVFLMSQEFSSEHSDRCVITRNERHVLFSNIGSVRDSSENFLYDLEASWQKSVFLEDICDIIYKHAANKFDCYIRYCTNQTFQERATQELQKRPETAEVIRRLERIPACQGLPMISFLLLPMQRITRLPLLVDAICHRLDPDTPKHKSACKALDALNKVVKKCNDGAKRMQQTEQMCHLARNLEFRVKEIPLISASRFLVKQGELTRIVTDSTSRIPFGKRASSKQPIYIYLFNDLLIVSKRKNNSTYVVTDYAKRNALHVENIDTPEKTKLLPNGVPSGIKNLFIVALLENHEQRQVEMVLSCKCPSDRTRWIDALSPTAKESDSEKIYEEWDCPQVQCIKRFNATEPDELGLEESDVVNVFKKMADGWYEGERIRDGEKGWFPSEHTEEIMNSHVRSRNLRLRYRLMLASQEYSNANVQGGMIKT
ncbi:serine-rich adhesin for platelets-like isoform X4 [Ostrea edulis]|uniref:serine-rich adhesin for platelets-like isoform X4 n=1 Tax=Ostrea edulis TaxID=37623 RepID=UPI0024AF270C|nr:serine-rich adhesin for platelets-like isoform X4 [Ostrea edulis]